MASSITFSGISSGLDTKSIITQLMLVESAPQTALKNKVTAEQNQLTSLQQINTALASLAESAASFATGSTWTKLTATSSNAAITVSASSSATQSSLDLVVGKVATAANATLAAGSSVAANTNFTVYAADGTTALASFDSGSGSFADVAKAINATSATSFLRAVVINSTDASGNPAPVLQLVSTRTGGVSDFSIKNTADGTDMLSSATYAAGTKAQLTVNGQSVTSDSNTVAVSPGVEVTLGANAAAAGANTATIGVSDDGSSRANSMKTFISQINGVLTTLSSTSSYGTVPTASGAASTDGGLLPGDSTLRALADQLVNAIFPSGGGTLETYGISVDRYGQLTFDSAKFTAAYAADPATAQAAMIGTGTALNGAPLTESFTSRIQAVAARASYSASGASSPFVTGTSTKYDGLLTAYIKSFQSQINDLNDDIAAWDDRLAMKQASLQTTYTNLETVMSKLSAQSSWLSSQIDGLPDLNSKN